MEKIKIGSAFADISFVNNHAVDSILIADIQNENVGNGDASKIIAFLKEYGVISNLAVTLWSIAYRDLVISQEQLDLWYKNHGFVEVEESDLFFNRKMLAFNWLK